MTSTKYFFACLIALFSVSGFAQDRSESLKSELERIIESNSKLSQTINDKVFSFSEPGYQEVETSKYLTNVLSANGFQVERDVSGIPTAWKATWGSGKPVIALGANTFADLYISQKPGVPYKDPLVAGSPGMGSGNNSAIAMNILAAISLKQLMMDESLPGTLMIWGGVGSDKLGSTQYMARDGHFDDVDLCIFSESSGIMNVIDGPVWKGQFSVEYTFENEYTQLSNASRTRRVNDASTIFKMGWDLVRKDINALGTDSLFNALTSTSSSSVLNHNFNDITYRKLKSTSDRALEVAQGAASMTYTTVKRNTTGAGWPTHLNSVVAQTLYANIERVGMPEWDDDDQLIARTLQKEADPYNRPTGLNKKIEALGEPEDEFLKDDFHPIGDVSWITPSAIFKFPSNVPNVSTETWAGVVAAATPIAHKGIINGAKVLGMTGIDFIVSQNLINQAKDVLTTQKNRGGEFTSLLESYDEPRLSTNSAISTKFKEEKSLLYFDDANHDSYLSQLGVDYPTRLLTKPNLAKQDQYRRGVIFGLGYGMAYSSHADSYEETLLLLTKEFSGLRLLVVDTRFGWGLNENLMVYGTWKGSAKNSTVSPYRSSYLGLAASYYPKSRNGFSFHGGFGKYSSKIDEDVTSGAGTLLNLGFGLEFVKHLVGEINILTGKMNPGNVEPNPFDTREFNITFSVNYLFY